MALEYGLIMDGQVPVLRSKCQLSHHLLQLNYFKIQDNLFQNCGSWVTLRWGELTLVKDHGNTHYILIGLERLRDDLGKKLQPPNLTIARSSLPVHVVNCLNKAGHV